MIKELLLYSQTDYRDYLKGYLENRRALEKGVQSRLAEVIGCQPAYVSKVLAKGAHFSLEQAERVSYFCNHTEDEKHFYLLLTQHSRAGTPALKKYFATQLQELRLKNKSLKEHMKLEKVSDLETQLKYYGHWTISAIHVLLTIPEFRTRSSISAKLNISIPDVNTAIDFLKAKGMIEETAGVLKVGTVGLHLGSDSPVVKQHHNNWRLKAMDSIARGNADNLHYSSVISISQFDRDRLRAELVKGIAQFKNTVELSKEETLVAIGVDFFDV